MNFDELYVVSDLHMGGEPGFQILNQGDTLSALIRELSSKDEGRSLGLVLNGDVVDFLAEQPPTYLDTKGAIGKLKRIIADPAFSDIWKALQEFVSNPGKHLILVLGNHDVELALPTVINWLTEFLCDGSDTARGRIIFSVDGTGFACTVGGKNVLCVHGNEVDGFNYVDRRQLLNVCREMNRGKEPKAWKANPGTRMVIDIMNDIKKDYPMVDLLKPEVEAALPVIAALDPSSLKKIPSILKLGIKSEVDKKLLDEGFLSADDDVAQRAEESDDEIMSKFLSANFDLGKGTNSNSGDLLGDALSDLDDGSSVEDLVEDEFLMVKEAVGLIGTLLSNKKDKPKQLRKTLKQWLDGDRSFDPSYQDTPFEELDRIIGDEIDYLVSGHTHLERAIVRDNGKYYFNSGTWIRLIQLTDHMLEHDDQFEMIFDAFKSRSIEALDDVNELGPNTDESLILLKPTVVSIISDSGNVYGELCHAQKDGTLKSVSYTRFPEQK